MVSKEKITSFSYSPILPFVFIFFAPCEGATSAPLSVMKFIVREIDDFRLWSDESLFFIHVVSFSLVRWKDDRCSFRKQPQMLILQKDERIYTNELEKENKRLFSINN